MHKARTFKTNKGQELSYREIGSLANLHIETVKLKLKDGKSVDTIIKEGNKRSGSQYEGKPCLCGCGVIVKKRHKWANGRICRYNWLLQERDAGRLKPDRYNICKQCLISFAVYKALNTLKSEFCSTSCGSTYYRENLSTTERIALDKKKSNKKSVKSFNKKRIEKQRRTICFRPTAVSENPCKHYYECWLNIGSNRECTEYKPK